MNKRAFTFPEVLGVIVILSIIAIVSYPLIADQINKSNAMLSSTQKKIIYSATKDYVNENEVKFPKVIENTFCIPVKDLVDNGYVDEKTVKFKNNDLENHVIKADVISYNYVEYNVVKNNECTEILINED